MTTTRRSAVLLIVGLIVIASCGSNGASKKSLSGYELDPPPIVGGFSLPDASNGGADFPFIAAEGRMLIVYFGYTSCPDVCPTTLAEVKKGLAQMGDDAADVDLAMATIDPDRDTDARLTSYVQSFIPGAHALRTDDPDALLAAADAFGASYSVTTNDAGEIEVSHGAAMYVVDSTGTVVLTWTFGVPADGIATDLEILLDRDGN